MSSNLAIPIQEAADSKGFAASLLLARTTQRTVCNSFCCGKFKKRLPRNVFETKYSFQMMSKISLTVLLLVSLYSFSFGQSNNKQDSKTETPSGCGYVVSTLEAIHFAAGEKGLIFIISRLGKKEKENSHNLRINAARIYIMKSGSRASETIITAKGENVDGLGRLEIYICNNLIEVIKMSKNSGLLVDCYSD